MSIDLIDGIYRLMMSDEHDPVNIGNPSELTMLELAEKINQIVGNKAPIKLKAAARLGDDPQRRRPDITRANEDPGLGTEVQPGRRLESHHPLL